VDPDDTTSRLTIVLPAALHDELCARASADGVGVNQLARWAIEREMQARRETNIRIKKYTVTRIGRY